MFYLAFIGVAFLFPKNAMFSQTVPDVEIKKCESTTDLKCISESATSFVREIAIGFQPNGIQPMDILHLNSIKTNVLQGMTVYYKNFTMTGFEDVNVKVLEFDINRLSVERMTFDYYAISNILFQRTSNEQQTFYGNYFSQGRAVLTVSYHFDITNRLGKDYFDHISAEDVECEVKDHPKPKFKINRELSQALAKAKEQDVQNYMKKRTEDEIDIFKKELCVVLKKAVATVYVPGVQKGLKQVPVSSFFQEPDLCN